WSAALVLLHPAFVYYDTHKLHPLSFDALAMSAAVYVVMISNADDRWTRVMASGVVVGLAILQRGSMLLFWVATILWAARWNRWRWQRLAVYSAGVGLVLAPLVVRNYAIHHMVLLESMTPQQFWKGNARYSNGSGYLADGRNVYDAAPPRLVAAWQQQDE